MPEKRKKYDRAFREELVRIVEATGKPIVQGRPRPRRGRGTLGNWVQRARDARGGSSSLSKNDYAELPRYGRRTRSFGRSAR
jgi:transposase